MLNQNVCTLNSSLDVRQQLKSPPGLRLPSPSPYSGLLPGLASARRRYLHAKFAVQLPSEMP